MESAISREERFTLDREAARYWLNLWWALRCRPSWCEEVSDEIIESLRTYFLDLVTIRIVAAEGLLISIHDIQRILKKHEESVSEAVCRLVTRMVIYFDGDFSFPGQVQRRMFSKWVIIVMQLAARFDVMPASLFAFPEGLDRMLQEFYDPETYRYKHTYIIQRMSHYWKGFDPQAAMHELEDNIRRLWSKTT